MKNYSALLSANSYGWDEWVQSLSTLEGFLGLLELPDADTTTFRPTEDFDVLEFGSEAAKRCLEWMENDFERTELRRFARIYFSREVPPNLAVFAAEMSELGGGSEVISLQEEVERDYQAEFRKSFRGTRAGSKFWIGPQWEKPPEDLVAIYVEPGMAFGTGDHPTTRLCVGMLEARERMLPPPQKILDLGTGTGVLALAAMKLFPSAQIWATDLDPQCAEDFQRTVEMNKTEISRFQAYFGAAADLRKLDGKIASLDLLISNIYAEVLLGLLEPISALMSPGAHWIVSGILAGPSSEGFESRVTSSGYEILDRRSEIRTRPSFQTSEGLAEEREEWIALFMTKSR